MITRIVKLTFKESRVDDFKVFVTGIKDKVRNYPGCNHLDIFRDIHKKNIIFTYSLWDSEESLNHYRYSDFFKSTWKTLMPWFADNPEAWSVDTL
ncbi:MAG: antibiotic biosynthesis monooxygenase [bacterium]|nr:antibiotic biosynthesis monooxygenase [bacterium]